MVIPRTVLRRKTQYLVALPREIRDALKLQGGSVVYWHAWRDGEVVLTPRATRKGGKPPRVDLQRELKAAHAQIDVLNRQLEELPHRARNQAWFELAQKELKLQLTGLPVIGAIHNRLAAIEALLQGRLASGVLNRRRPRGAAQPRTSNPRPDPPPSEASEGAATSGGAAPQVAQPDMTVQHL